MECSNEISQCCPYIQFYFKGLWTRDMIQWILLQLTLYMYIFHVYNLWKVLTVDDITLIVYSFEKYLFFMFCTFYFIIYLCDFRYWGCLAFKKNNIFNLNDFHDFLFIIVICNVGQLLSHWFSCRILFLDVYIKNFSLSYSM